MKKVAVFAASVLMSISALAQESVQTSTTKPLASSRGNYIADGFLFGAAYENMAVKLNLKLTNKLTNYSYTVSGESESNTDFAGVKIAYAKMPKSGWGLNMGLTPMKMNRSTSDNKTYYYTRGEGNVTIATPMAVLP